MFGYVYRVTNTDTGSFYIGKHKFNPEESFLDYLGSSTHPDFDLSKYPRSAFVKCMIDEADSEKELTELEAMYIQLSLSIPGCVNSVKGIGFGGQYGYSDNEWADKSKQTGEYAAFCPKCNRITTHYKNGACKSCVSEITYDTHSAKSYFKKTYEYKVCEKCGKPTKHTGKTHNNCMNCYNRHGYNLVKHDEKVSLRNGTNTIIDDVSFILDSEKEGNTIRLPEGIRIADGESTTTLKAITRNDNVEDWLCISTLSRNGRTKQIHVTSDHPLITAASDFVKARNLKLSDNLISSDNSLKQIVSIAAEDRTAHSYDVTTESGFFNFSGFRSRNCRTRVVGNVYDPTRQIVTGRGNLSFTSINLPRLAIKANHNIDFFFDMLEREVTLVIDQLTHRYQIQAKKKVKNYPFLMGQGVWLDSDKLSPNDYVGEVLKHGTLTVGFIGLAEALTALIGEHHGQSQRAQSLGLEIVGYMRKRCDDESQKTKMNYTLIATPAEGLSGRFVRMDKKRYGIIPGVTDKDYYTNSFHIPVKFNINAYDKIRLEAPYHALTNAGHISYVELDGDPVQNLEAFESIIRYMKECGIGYGSINHPVDRDPVCGYTGIINDVCPRCGRREGEPVSAEKLKELGMHKHLNSDIIGCCGNPDDRYDD